MAVIASGVSASVRFDRVDVRAKLFGTPPGLETIFGRPERPQIVNISLEDPFDDNVRLDLVSHSLLLPIAMLRFRVARRVEAVGPRFPKATVPGKPRVKLAKALGLQ
jgi:hypothetical protein